MYLVSQFINLLNFAPINVSMQRVTNDIRRRKGSFWLLVKITSIVIVIGLLVSITLQISSIDRLRNNNLRVAVINADADTDDDDYHEDNGSNNDDNRDTINILDDEYSMEIGSDSMLIYSITGRKLKEYGTQGLFGEQQQQQQQQHRQQLQRFPSISQHTIIHNIEQNQKTAHVVTDSVFELQKQRNQYMIDEKIEWTDIVRGFFPADGTSVNDMEFDYMIDEQDMGMTPTETDNDRTFGNLILHTKYRPFSAIMHQSSVQSESESIKNITSNISGFSTGGSIGINTFKINYDSNVPKEVRNCVEAATLIWSAILGVTRVPITIRVMWKSQKPNVLAATGPSYIYLLKSRGMYYPDALVNQIMGEDVDPVHNDIQMTINQNQAKWHYDITVLPPPGKYDLVTTILHEIWHGLGGIGIIGRASRNRYPYPYPIVYDKYVVDKFGTPVTSITSNLLKTILRDDVESLYFNNNNNNNDNDIFSTNSGSGGFNADSEAALFFPKTFSPGSSIYHLSEKVYQNTDPLMTPFLNTRERILKIGPIPISILETLGWSVRRCDNYDANCVTCVDAGCIWCDGSCYSTDALTEDCPNSDNMIYDGRSCPECYRDQDCDDGSDKCNIGYCDQQTGRCIRSIQLDCSDNDPCTIDICNSDEGCVHHYNVLNCDNSYNIDSSNIIVGNLNNGDSEYEGTGEPPPPSSPCTIMGQEHLLQNCYLCKTMLGERLSTLETHDHIGSVNSGTRPVFSIIVGKDIPNIPHKFFGKKSAMITGQRIDFTWCNNDVHYVSIVRHNSVQINVTSTQITNIMGSYVHLCSITDINVPQDNGSGLVSKWSVEISLSGNSKFLLDHKSMGYIAYKFADCQYMLDSRVYLEILPRLTFYNIISNNLQQKILDYGSPSGYLMPYVTLFDGTISGVNLDSYHNSYVMSN